MTRRRLRWRGCGPAITPRRFAGGSKGGAQTEPTSARGRRPAPPVSSRDLSLSFDLRPDLPHLTLFLGHLGVERVLLGGGLLGGSGGAVRLVGGSRFRPLFVPRGV